MADKKLEDIKKEIRSILISFQNGCTLREFQHNYKALIGRPLPSASFSHPSDEAFLGTMPDVVHIRPSIHGQFPLPAIADDSTRHIQKMVLRQKPTKRKPAPSGRHPPPVRPAFRPSTWRPPPRFLPTKRMPSTLRENMLQLVQSFPSGIVLSDFLSCYQSAFQDRLRFRDLGFFTLQDCLETVPELYLLTTNNEIFVHCKRTKVSLGKVTALQRKSPDLQPRPHAKKPDKGLSSLSIAPSISYSLVEIDKQPSIQRTSTPNPEDSNDTQQPTPVYGTPIKENVDSSVNNVAEVENAAASREPEDIPPFVLKNLTKIANMYRQGIWATDFPDLYQNEIKTEFDLHSLGYNDLSSFIDAVPDIFRRENAMGTKKNWLIYPAGQLPHRPNSTETLPNSSALLMEDIITNAKQLLQAYPEGIKLGEFAHIYSINCSKPLCVKDLGFDGIESFLLSIASRVPLMLATSIDGKSVHLVQASEVRAFQFAPNMEVTELPPTDILLPNAHIESVKLPSDFNYSKYFPVYASTIESPGRLYIQLKGSEYSERMHQLYDDMEAFYNCPECGRYKMQNAHIKVGAVCVAVWPADQHWYRVKILSIISLESVQVFYFDYGTKEEIPTSMLRYMKKKYSTLPAQALLSCLACLTPPQKASFWKPEARVQMLRLCKDVSLMACIDSIRDDGVLCLILCDTNGEKDTYINDILLSEGLADCSVETQQESLNPLQLLQAQLMMQAYASTVAPSDLARVFQGLSINPAATCLPSPVHMEVPVPSPMESEVFEDDDDIFNQLYSKVVSVMKRYVKRIRTCDGYVFHILSVDAQPYVSSGDISGLIWGNQDSDCLAQRLRNRDVTLPSRTLSEEDNKDMFYQIQRFFVKGCQKVGNMSQILIYSLDSVIEILNLFGQPSVELRNRITRELASFNPRHPSWQELSEAEIPEKEEVRMATDDDKLNRLCLYDLLAMKESIRIRKMECGGSEVLKMNKLLEKVVERIQQIKLICDKFKPL